MYYVKKVIPTKAVRLEPDNEYFLLNNGWVSEIVYDGDHLSHAFVDTLEGKMKSYYGDYIMEGVSGEHWSIKADIFEKTYQRYDPYRHNVDTQGNPPEFKPGDKVVVGCNLKDYHPDYACIGKVVQQKYIENENGQVEWGSILVSVNGYKQLYAKNEVMKLKM